jgi:hypothetical protein
LIRMRLKITIISKIGSIFLEKDFTYGTLIVKDYFLT